MPKAPITETLKAFAAALGKIGIPVADVHVSMSLHHWQKLALRLDEGRPSRARRGIPVEGARAQVEQHAQRYQQTVDQVQQQAAEAADTAADVASTAALFGFVALVLGALAAWFGGRFGTVEPTITAFRSRVSARRF